MLVGAHRRSGFVMLIVADSNCVWMVAVRFWNLGDPAVRFTL